MKFSKIVVLVFLLLSLSIAGCLPAERLSGNIVQETPASEPTIEQSAATTAPEPTVTINPTGESDGPENAALRFYQAYIEAEAQHQPAIGSAEFPAQAYLSQAYLTQLAEIKAGFDGAGFDPVLQTQMVPPGPVEVKESSSNGDQATVIIQFGKGVIEPPWERTVSLQKIDGQWQIIPDLGSEAGKTPEETVRAFYTWYLGYIGSGSQQRNPLADHAYRNGPFLENALVFQVDRRLEAGEGQGNDPFLCSQAVPAEMNVYASFYNGAHPVVVMRSNLPGHTVVLDLVRENFNRWAIRAITCGDTPEGTVKAFYTWALGTITSTREPRNPWVDGDYRESPFLSQAMIGKLDQLMASGQPLAADPVLFAQDIPLAFNVERCQEENCALIHMQYGDSLIHQVRAELTIEDSQLKIDRLQPASEIESPQPSEPLSGVERWVPFRDEQFGYAVRYPSDWQVSGLKVTDTHPAQEYPILRAFSFNPPALGGFIVPFGLEVIRGDEAKVKEWYGLSEPIGKTEANGYPATIYRVDPGMIYSVFQHPSQPDTWVVLTDTVTQFPGREEMAKQVEGVFDRIISTIAFSK